MENDRPKIEAIRVETPFGALESDSGNHAADMLTIVALIIILYFFKRMYSAK